jgi:hypothetical protein
MPFGIRAAHHADPVGLLLLTLMLILLQFQKILASPSKLFCGCSSHCSSVSRWNSLSAAATGARHSNSRTPVLLLLHAHS